MLPPSPLLLFIASYPCSSALELLWPRHALNIERLYDKGGSAPKRETVQNNLLSLLNPVRVRKMSGDQGEMFSPSYWGFDTDEQTSPNQALGKRKSDTGNGDSQCIDLRSNSTLLPPLRAPFSLHSLQQSNPVRHHLLHAPRTLFSIDKRDFQCPSGTAACRSINQPNSCCPSGSTCELLTSGGSGAVGCCTAGQTCSQEVASCQEGYTSCPGDSGGGCCVPGYSCMGVGCMYISCQSSCCGDRTNYMTIR